MHDDELRFISDINAKKENAWKRLYQNYYPALCNYASRIIQDEVIVEDIVQESLINLWDFKILEVSQDGFTKQSIPDH